MWRARAADGLAVGLGVLILGLGALSVVLDSLIHQHGTGGPVADALTTAAGVVPVTAVGMLLAARRPRNPIGWMLLAIVIIEGYPTSQYLILDYRMHHGTLPLGGLAVVLQECWPLFLVLTSLLLWLFPDGTLAGGRWPVAPAGRGGRSRLAAGGPGPVEPGGADRHQRRCPRRGQREPFQPADRRVPCAQCGGDRRDPDQLAGLAGRSGAGLSAR
jgi:hypothetical protein